MNRALPAFGLRFHSMRGRWRGWRFRIFMVLLRCGGVDFRLWIW